ncbi:MAG: ribonuclease D [Thiotrichales bacterium]|nr:ribonuclease D [Thiotrichales bacterium]
MPDTVTAPASIMISNDASLAAACRRWSAAQIIGLDTEFIRERTYHPRPALLQVSDAQGVLLVDPTEISDYGSLAEVLADPAVLIVMHACGEDLEVLEVMTGIAPRRVFDTQLAAAFAGHGYTLGYRDLVATLLDITLDKGETRSNWLKRPLSPSQVHYATLDVLYLLPLYRDLSADLNRMRRTSWLEEEFAHQRRNHAADSRPEASYLRVQGRGVLSPPRHAVLRRLSAWRETVAMARDMPRRHLLPDRALIALAGARPPTGGRLQSVNGISPRFRRRYESTVAKCIRAALADGPAGVDYPTNMRPHADTLARMRDTTRQAAEHLGLAPEVLATRRALESLLAATLKHQPIPPEFQGWRHAVVTPALLDCTRV